MDTTLQSIIEIALQQGIWAALYIYLFFRMLKENAERETQYQQMINHLSTNVVEGIADINDKLDDMARRLDNGHPALPGGLSLSLCERSAT